MTKSRDICEFYFTALQDSHYKCNMCHNVRKQTPASGFSNRMGHLAAKHNGFLDEFEAHQRMSFATIKQCGFVDVDYLPKLPLCEVENPSTRTITILKPVSTVTMKRYNQHVAKKLGERLKIEMGSSFGIIFDGPPDLAVYLLNGERKQRLLAISLMEDGQTADAHIDHFESVLAVYAKAKCMVKFLVGDNCSTNKAVATKWGIPLVGCASHRFNLAVAKILAERHENVDAVRQLMLQLRQLNNAAEKLTPRRPVLSNATRWSSTFAMLDRYLALREHAKTIAAVEESVPSQFIGKLWAFIRSGSVCVKLQLENASLADVCTLFDACIELHPSMGDYLKPSAPIIHALRFESAVVKCINELPLTATEATVLVSMVTPVVSSNNSAIEPEDFATAVLRRAKRVRRSERLPVTYSPLVARIPPTSNFCERLFSQCKFGAIAWAIVYASFIF
ncbi:TPA: hypothetical protein N0F65_006663 [Lagenidium giganteum]|uniref:BED-type domain-containing protein n=1 Tax=Lagenidium giganteum TaxID=4803 RepID=A0AAV2YJG4_9STRA|nr:TPA: hypothetical protein N0F65_006663 [Lagenidium giganteum]